MRYVHTNIIAKDWRKLSLFYQTVFGCKPVYPERDLHGEWLDGATRIRGAHIRGIHLLLPGYGADGPTLEIFQYNVKTASPEIFVNSCGFGHIAFAVEDVKETVRIIRKNGGKDYGKLTKINISGKGYLIFQYLKDPEGNIIELQKWSGSTNT